MSNFFWLLGAFALFVAVVWGWIKWSRRGQRKISKAADKGWEEAGRKF